MKKFYALYDKVLYKLRWKRADKIDYHEVTVDVIFFVIFVIAIALCFKLYGNL